MCDWVCYLIRSLDSNDTYIGSSNNFKNRLNNHNNCDPTIKRKGAKRTRGQTWEPVLIISGFDTKSSCLSFEAGWKRLSKYRNNNKLFYLNILLCDDIKYGRDTVWNRIIDLLFFVYNIAYVGDKFVLDPDQKIPCADPGILTINSYHDSIKNIHWPYFIFFCNNFNYLSL